MSGIGRLYAGLIALSALGALTLQTYIDVTGLKDTLISAIWSQSRYFTNLMVFAVGAFFAIIFVRNSGRFAGWHAALTVWIVIVGVVYHVLLANTHYPEGGDVVVNLFQHTIVPILVVGFWLTFAPKSGLNFKLPLIWLICPLGYVSFALSRGLADGKFPYFFLNPDKIGWAGVGLYIVGLGAAFYVLGAAIVFLGKLLNR